MISFRDVNENDIGLDFRGPIYAWHHGKIIVVCEEQPEMWDQWKVTIDGATSEAPSDANLEVVTSAEELQATDDLKGLEDFWRELKHKLVSAYTANVVATRCLPKALWF
jgi:hypothetical protein